MTAWGTSWRKLAGTNSHKSFHLRELAKPAKADFAHKKTFVSRANRLFFDRDVCFPREQSNEMSPYERGKAHIEGEIC